MEKLRAPNAMFQLRDTLEPVVSARYDEKLKLILGTDPYKLTTWSPDIKLLPTYPHIVNFLVYSPSAYTEDDLNVLDRKKALKHTTTLFVDLYLVLHSQRLRGKPVNS
ncbi:LOW QUALITY PROTEIN: hypothetical protein MAR_038385 [Mya arenaria]|uniref:Uncharacterized protein n=1 Tax=Mya arenaria TaxID=6604 RepID=A0ABY7G034_MYAAR|nr:LOW QUALITY PROTEIN: hypothetical protein MAR_038385 [Mya arenaria]